MKKFYWFWIVSLAFILGVIITAIWVKLYPRIYQFEEAVSADVSKTNYCDLVKNPYKYDGKIVRIDANLHWFMHGYFLADIRCSDEGDSARMAISFNEQKSNELYKQLEKYHQPGEMWKPLEIIAVGVFRYEMSSGSSDHIVDRTSLQFEIYKIEYTAR